MIINENGTFKIPEAEKGLPSQYIQELVKALDSEFHAKMFLINTLGPEIFSCLTRLDMDITELAKSLMEYERDPKISLDRSGKFFETFLHRLGNDIGVSLVGKTGVISAIEELQKSGKILKNQYNLGRGLGGSRNIGSHGMDAETQQEWHVTPQASLATTIMVPVVVRSLYLYAKNKNQEF
jgi:hypothetical protein